ncbi:uncharacterized protein LOC113921743 [Zalophus californianus]|uniref:Uncharacterized protein LOC113921743 n=1 Tax=Zalophus californianus TaxID=9704 RepID=A0A6J2CWR0_ZALCA|nr:uncharacterized protein LOC113921743 [Zalophus californianus]
MTPGVKTPGLAPRVSSSIHSVPGACYSLMSELKLLHQGTSITFPLPHPTAGFLTFIGEPHSNLPSRALSPSTKSLRQRSPDSCPWPAHDVWCFSGSLEGPLPKASHQQLRLSSSLEAKDQAPLLGCGSGTSAATHHFPPGLTGNRPKQNSSPSPWKTALQPVSLTFVGSNTIPPSPQARNRGTILTAPFLTLTTQGPLSPVNPSFCSLSTCSPAPPCLQLRLLLSGLPDASLNPLPIHLLPANTANLLTSESDGVGTVRRPLTAWLLSTPPPPPRLALGLLKSSQESSQVGLLPGNIPLPRRHTPLHAAGQLYPSCQAKPRLPRKPLLETLLTSTPCPATEAQSFCYLYHTKS